MIYFGSDWHLEHKNILGFTDRPFDDIEIMKDVFLYEWKQKVCKDDTVYLLGDISFHNRSISDFENLPGNKILIRGNHDPSKFAKSSIWNDSRDYAEIKINNQLIILMHYPIESWRNMQHGSIHLHGHTHNNASHEIFFKRNRIDVGYDHTRQALSTLEELLDLQRREEISDKYNRIYDIIEGNY